MELTEKQKRFCDEYIICGNATQSYINAGYKATTRDVAEANARKLLGNYSVAQYIEEKKKRLEIKVEWKQEEILRDIKQIAQDVNNEVKDRLKAYELGGKHLGMFKDKLEVTGNMVVFKGDDSLED